MATTSITTIATTRSQPPFTAPATTTPPPAQPPSGPSSPASTPAPGAGGGGQGGSIVSFFNLTVINNYFFAPPSPEWNTGHAGVIQYITINEERDRHAGTMVSFLMVAGFLAIAAIGARLFLRVRGGQLQYTHIPASEPPPAKRKEIPLPIRLPPPPAPPPPAPPREQPLLPVSDDQNVIFHFPGIPKLLERRRSSRDRGD